MDELDFKIFKSLDFRPFGDTSGDLSRLNPWVIAKKVGADGNTVKLRLNKMKRSGFIQYFQIYPNFRLLGMRGSAYLFNVRDVLEKYEIIDKCSLVDGVTEIHNFIGSHLCIDFTYLDSKDEGRRLELFRRLTHCESPERFYERIMPSVEIDLSNTDWRIIKALRYNAFKPLSVVAKELGLSAKTVRRRFERMAENNAVIIAPLVNLVGIPDTITYVMLLYPSPGRREEVLNKAMEEFNDTCFLARTSPPRERNAVPRRADACWDRGEPHQGKEDRWHEGREATSPQRNKRVYTMGGLRNREKIRRHGNLMTRLEQIRRRVPTLAVEP